MNYFKEINVAVTVCDKEGKIVDMNDKGGVDREKCIGLSSGAGPLVVGGYAAKSEDTRLYDREERGEEIDLPDAVV